MMKHKPLSIIAAACMLLCSACGEPAGDSEKPIGSSDGGTMQTTAAESGKTTQNEAEAPTGQESVTIFGQKYKIAVATQLHLSEQSVTDELMPEIARLVNLEELWLKNNQITDTSELAKLTKLTTLYLGGNMIVDIDGLANLSDLESLELYGNKIAVIPDLSKLVNLTNLHLGENEITDITGLENLTGLKQLNLNKNYITDITGLANLTNLEYLDLSSNHITDISSLGNLTNLKNLELHDNLFSKDDLAKLREKLPNCTINAQW